MPSLIKKFHRALETGNPVTIWGNGSAQRDFLYVKDVARAVHLVLQNGGGAINMGSGSVYSIHAIVEMLMEITGLPPSRVEWDESKPNGQDYRAYDLTNIRALGFRPIYEIEDALTETWEWYLKNPV